MPPAKKPEVVATKGLAPHWQTPGRETVKLYLGDALEVLRELPSASVQCCVTSPGYYGLRDYKCHGVSLDGQTGMEETPDEYVAGLVLVFREVRRVMRDDAALWLNLGDSYSNDTKWGGSTGGKHVEGLHGDTSVGRSKKSTGIAPGNLVGIPWRVAFALQADGWVLRSDIPWVRRSPMPESVTSRPTKALEYVFMLTKGPGAYFDMEAVRTTAKYAHDRRAGNREEYNGSRIGEEGTGQRAFVSINPAGRSFRNSDPWFASVRAPHGVVGVGDEWVGLDVTSEPLDKMLLEGRHFAAFPSKLVEPLILAGTSKKGACARCGAPWRRVVDRPHRGATTQLHGEDTVAGNRYSQDGKPFNGRNLAEDRALRPVTTLGWEPSCSCDGIDRRIVATPTGERAGDDPSLETGRAGYNRPRGPDEGQRPITRYEQSRYAVQLKVSPHRAEMEAEGGPAFAHYVRTDESGARPVPDELLEAWIGRGWLERVVVPPVSALEAVPCVVLDPFAGTCTTGAVAVRHGRRFVGIDLSSEYLDMGVRRIVNAEGGGMLKDLKRQMRRK